ncbi:NUDIX domain-containing protein [Microbacterium sp. ZW T5_45]|uniref:NUDIX domain-containing protein n=1 Tax=Microbacterium sp. ZW T5_45 TaxID=3378080 RepID=UPI00385380A7
MAAFAEVPVAGTVVILRDSVAGLEVLLMQRPARGSFASAWVFPGGRVEPVDLVEGESEQDAAVRAGIREVREEVGLVVSELEPISVWTPPPGIPTRIRTWFFRTRTWSGELSPAAEEVSDVAWISPAEALARHAAGEWTLVPPTWITLHDLSERDLPERGARDLPDAVTDEPRSVRSYETRVEGTVFLWEGLRLQTAALPWTLSERP